MKDLEKMRILEKSFEAGKNLRKGVVADSALESIELIAKSIMKLNVADDEKKHMFFNVLCGLKKEKKIFGVKNEHVNLYSERVLGIHGKRNDVLKSLDPEVNGFTMKQILYYVSYANRVIKSEPECSNSLIMEREFENERLIRQKEKEYKLQEKKRKKTEAELQEKLSSMSAVERFEFEFNMERKQLNPQEFETYVVEQFNSLEKLDGETRIKAAQLIKEYYIEKGKWKVKPKKKQYEKVVKIKQILGE